ncbi:MAG: EthD family reductase [Acidimicrobiales bacterium]
MKRLDFFKRRPDLDLAAFRAQVQETYAGSPCVLHFTHDTGYRAHEPNYDCVLEMPSDDSDAAPRADQRGFSDPSTFGSVLAHEVVIVDGGPPAGSFTMFAFLNRLPGTEPAAFHAYWRDHHGPIAARVPGLRRYVQNQVISASGKAPAFDGIAQTWFDDLDALRMSAKSEELERTRADEPNFMISGRLPFVVCAPAS